MQLIIIIDFFIDKNETQLQDILRPVRCIGASLLCAVFLVLAIPALAVPAGSVETRDALGRLIRLPAPAERIVTIPMPAAAMVVAVDRSAKRLVGMHRQSGVDAGGQILVRMFPSLREISTDVVGEGFMPNVEEILSIRPDLILQWGDRGDALIRPLEAVGLTVAAFTFRGETDARDWLRTIAALIGQPERAKTLIDWRDAVQKQLAPLAALPSEDRPKALYLLRARSGLIAAGAGTFNEQSIELAGGRNAAEGIEGSKPVNAEQVLAWNPDVILLNTFEANLTPDVILKHPLLRLTEAARTGRVFVMPTGGYRWDPPSAESPLSWLWLARLLQPERSGITREDMVAAIIDGYKLVYGKTIDRALALEILNPTPEASDKRRTP
ncbi:MAG: ABC transporter substrate-binding protein [Thiobacillus sp.]|nr:ABC transporter substrate-binding protein [Thiobacillus sp.]